MENANKKIKFDPGFAPLVINSLGAVGYMYYMFSSLPNNKIKKLNFNTISPKLEKNLEINTSFYLGCLMWASYISNFENYEIEGNQLLGEDAKEEEYTGELDFLIDFTENKYPRDVKYYQNKIYTPDSRFIAILKTYREFLVINKGFCACSNTNEIMLPKNLKTPSNTGILKEKIYNAIENKDLTLLLKDYNLLFG